MTDTRLLLTFAVRVRERRRELGMTQAALGRKAGFTGQTIWNIEAGVHEPGLFKALMVAHSLGVSLDDLTAPAQGGRRGERAVA